MAESQKQKRTKRALRALSSPSPRMRPFQPKPKVMCAIYFQVFSPLLPQRAPPHGSKVSTQKGRGQQFHSKVREKSGAWPIKPLTGSF